MRPRARVLYAASETDPDILYPTGFFAPDPFLFVQAGGKRVLVMSDLEMDRARRQATVDEVLSWTAFARKVEARGGRAGAAAVIAAALRHLKVRTVAVPRNFPLGLSMELDELGVRLEVEADPFWPEREIKTATEVRAIRAALRAAEAGLAAGIAALQGCRIGRDGWLRRDGRRFTAEDLRAAVNTRILAEGCLPSHTICAPGDQAVDPHEEGHGPIRAHTPVVMDIFPRSERTGYYGDLTRTVVRGRASDALRAVYALVHEGVRLGHRRVRPGADGIAIHREIQALFDVPRLSHRRPGRPHAGLLPRHRARPRPADPRAAVDLHPRDHPARGPRGDGGAGALLPRAGRRADRGRRPGHRAGSVNMTRVPKVLEV